MRLANLASFGTLPRLATPVKTNTALSNFVNWCLGNAIFVDKNKLHNRKAITEPQSVATAPVSRTSCTELRRLAGLAAALAVVR